LPVWARSCGRITAHYVHFSSQVTCEVLLHGDSSFGMSVEIIFQRANLPTHGANRLDRYRIHVGWNATQEKRGAHEVTRDQVTNDMFVPRHPHFPADKQRDTSHTFAMLDQSLARDVLRGRGARSGWLCAGDVCGRVPAESRGILARMIGLDSKWIFLRLEIAASSSKEVNGAHDRVCVEASKAGILFSFVLYDFRRTFATRLAQAGIDLATLAAILGHSSSRLVQRCVHPTAEHRRSAMLQYDEITRAAEKAASEQRRRTN
jgi:hypothetical protein